MSRCVLSSFFLLVLACSACGTAAVRDENPLKRVTGKAAPVEVLGSSYTVPGNLDVNEFVDKPGSVYFEGVDRITSCSYTVLFESVGDSSSHRKWIDGVVKADAADYTQAGVKLVQTANDVPLFGQQGRTQRFALAKDDDTATKMWIDAHDDGASLSVLSSIFCDDPGLADKSLTAVLRFIDSRGGEEAAPD